MQRINFPKRGGLAMATWVSLAIFAAATLLFVVFSVGWVIWLPAGLGAAFCFFWFPYTFRYRYLTVGGTELRVSIGRMFRKVRRLPRRHITGCSLIATPLQRALGVCILIVYTPGSAAFLIGLRRADGDALAAQLMEE